MDPHFDPDMDQHWHEGSGPTLLICFPQCQGYKQRWYEVNFRKMRQNHIESYWVYKYAGQRDVLWISLHSSQWTWAESIEWLIEDQGFMPSYGFGSSSTASLPPLASASCLSFSVFLWKGGRGVRKEPNDVDKVLYSKKSFNILSETLSVLGRVAGRRYPRRRGRRPPAGGQRRGTGGRRRGWCSPTCPGGWRGGPPPLLSWLLVQ